METLLDFGGIENLPPSWGVPYLDGGRVLTDIPAAQKRPDAYKSDALEHSVWATELIPQTGQDYSNQTWCTADVLHHLGASQAVRQMNRIQTGIPLLANDSVSRQLPGLWQHVCPDHAYRYLDNFPSVKPNVESFQEHRHHQDFLNIIFRQMGLKAIPDETSHPEAPSTQESGFRSRAPGWAFTAPFEANLKRPLSAKAKAARRLGFQKFLQFRLRGVFQKKRPLGGLECAGSPTGSFSFTHKSSHAPLSPGKASTYSELGGFSTEGRNNILASQVSPVPLDHCR